MVLKWDELRTIKRAIMLSIGQSVAPVIEQFLNTDDVKSSPWNGMSRGRRTSGIGNWRVTHQKCQRRGKKSLRFAPWSRCTTLEDAFSSKGRAIVCRAAIFRRRILGLATWRQFSLRIDLKFDFIAPFYIPASNTAAFSTGQCNYFILLSRDPQRKGTEGVFWYLNLYVEKCKSSKHTRFKDYPINRKRKEHSENRLSEARIHWENKGYVSLQEHPVSSTRQVHILLRNHIISLRSSACSQVRFFSRRNGGIIEV